MDTSNVDTVFIAGRVMKRSGKLVGVDLARIQREAAASRDYLVGKLGWSRSVLSTRAALGTDCDRATARTADGQYFAMLMDTSDQAV